MKIGVEAIEYVLGEKRCDLLQLEAQGRLETPSAQLRAFGFHYAFLGADDAFNLASKAIAALLQKHNLNPEEIDAVFFAGALPTSHTLAGSGGPLSVFNYPACKLQYEFGLLNATVIGISQAGCMGMMSAVKCAADFLRANQAEKVLCVSADVFPSDAKREVLYNVISDGACALLICKNSTRNLVRAHRQITKGYYWDSATRQNEIIAAYFPTAKNIALGTLSAAGVDASEIACVIPHNVSRRSWDILLDLIGINPERLFGENIAAMGHVIAADNFMNLKDAAATGRIKAGDKLLLFNFGFGANWGCMLLEH